MSFLLLAQEINGDKVSRRSKSPSKHWAKLRTQANQLIGCRQRVVNNVKGPAGVGGSTVAVRQSEQGDKSDWSDRVDGSGKPGLSPFTRVGDRMTTTTKRYPEYIREDK